MSGRSRQTDILYNIQNRRTLRERSRHIEKDREIDSHIDGGERERESDKERNKEKDEFINMS